MNQYQHAIVIHLSETRERRAALADLCADHNILWSLSEEEVISRVNEYLSFNRRGFCTEGIKRFRDATGIQEPKPKTKTVRVTLDIETDSNIDHMSPDTDYALTPSLVEHIKQDIPRLTKAPWGTLNCSFNVVSVTEHSYEVL